MPQLDNILWVAGSIAEAGVIILLAYRRVFRSFPIFFAYSAWTLIGSLSAYAVLHKFPSAYLTNYIIEMVVDSILLFGVLVELGWSILKPVRAELSSKALFVVGLLILGLGAAIWPFMALPNAPDLSWKIGTLSRLQQTFSVLRVIVFLALAGFSQFLSIGWRDRELQIASGLGFTSLVGLGVAVLHGHGNTWVQYRTLNNIVVGSYICSLVYWAYCFAQPEAQRRKFSPQMQNMLLALAGSARSTRIGMTDIGPGKPPMGR